MNKLMVLVAAFLMVSGCAGGTSDEPTSTFFVVPSPTSAPPPIPAPASPATTASARPADLWQLPTPCDGTCDLEVLFEVPVGQSGIGYANVGLDEMEAYGPSALATTVNGAVWIADVVNNRLRQFALTGEAIASIDLTEYEVAVPIDIAAGPDGLLVLDVYPATQRYRVVELDAHGHFEEAHALPRGLWLEDGLTGVAWGPQGEIWVELEFGNRTATLDMDGPAVTFEETVGHPYPDGNFAPIPNAPFAYQAGSHRVSLDSDADLGGLTLIGVNQDGSFVLQMDEVTQDPNGAFRVNETLHLFDNQGEHVGTAIFPLEDQFIYVDHSLVVGGDGYPYALLTRPDSIAVARLAYTR